MSVCYGGQIVGARDNQEDAFRVIRQSDHDDASDVLILLADGMGGHTSGEVAARIAIETFERAFIAATQLARPEERLSAALEAANAALLEELDRAPEKRGMGCTFIGAIKVGHRLYWISVGDSLLYLLRGGRLVRLNADHSVRGELMEQVTAGRLSEEEARAHPRGNALRSALTGNAIALIDLNSTGLEPGDAVLVASDGLETLTEAQIAAIWGQNRRGPQRTVDALLAGVEKQGDPRQDNTTVVVYEFQSSSFVTDAPDTKWVLATRPGFLGLRVLLALLAVGAAGIALAIWLLWSPAPNGGDGTAAALRGQAAKPLADAPGAIGTVSAPGMAKPAEPVMPAVAPLPAAGGAAPETAAGPVSGPVQETAPQPAPVEHAVSPTQVQDAARPAEPGGKARCSSQAATATGEGPCLAPAASPAPQTRP